MARIAGVNIPENKHIEIALTHIFGIGRARARVICDAISIGAFELVEAVIITPSTPIPLVYFSIN